MCLRSRAASLFVAKLEESRYQSRKSMTSSSPYASQMLLVNSQTDDEMANLAVSPERTISNRENERELVLRLDAPIYDKSREYPGLSKLKVDRKERHLKTVHSFNLALEGIAEVLEDDLMRLSSEMKDELEDYDTNLKLQVELLNRNDYLLSKGKIDILNIKMKIQDTIKLRSSTIEKFSIDLGSLEVERSLQTNEELENLLDSLVGIAHKLIDEIESFIEDGAFELNTIITTNRISHSHLLQMLRKIQVRKEVETIQKYENAYMQWKLLHHNNALESLYQVLHGSEFNDRNDRRIFLENVKKEQNSRHMNRLNELKSLHCLSYDNISSDKMIKIKGNLQLINDNEINAIQVCNLYDYLTILTFVLFSFFHFLFFSFSFSSIYSFDFFSVFLFKIFFFLLSPLLFYLLFCCSFLHFPFPIFFFFSFHFFTYSTC